MTPLLPLDDFRRVIGYHPFHFWQLADSAIIPVTSACNTLVRKYAYQDVNAPGRNEVLEAIETAEGKLADYLGYWPAPKHIVETIPWQRFYNKALVRRMDWDPTGKWVSGRVKWGYIQEVGLETLTLIDTPRVVYSDQDGDGINDTATFSVNTTVTDATKLGAYFQATDRLDSEAAGAQWEIRPVKITFSAGVATFIAHSWLFVQPVLYEGFASGALDPTVAANFVGNVEVYKHQADPTGTTLDTSQGVIQWETAPCHGWWCGCSNCAATFTPASSSEDAAAYAQAMARVGIRDAVTGVVMPAESVYNTTAGVWSNVPWDVWREPDRVVVRYLAGKPLVNNDMDMRWQTIVARMAAAELAGRICACDNANRELFRWQKDLSRTSGEGDEAYGMTTKEQLNNPFGTRRGQVYAWNEVKRLHNMIGITAN